MNFHAKALLAFLSFHVIVTGGGLQFDQVPRALGQGVNTKLKLFNAWILSQKSRNDGLSRRSF
jgi:hypothetical protein